MGEYLERCEGGRAMSEEDMQLIFSKKRKLCSVQENVCCGDVKLSENSVSSAASVTYGCAEDDWSSDDVNKSFRSPDLENVGVQSESLETEISTSINGIFSRQSTPTTDVCGDSEQVLMRSSTSKKKSSLRAVSYSPNISSSTAEKTPTAEEIEEFFAAAEKYEQKRFAEKYNYDIVKDVPLEGKYQWVRLQP